MAVRRCIFFRQECAAEVRFHLKQVEIISANEQADDVQRIGATGHSHSRKRVCRHGTERRVLFGVILEVQIGHR